LIFTKVPSSLTEVSVSLTEHPFIFLNGSLSLTVKSLSLTKTIFSIIFHFKKQISCYKQ
jgi:hypothetical protein